jgi:putative membrane protein
MKELLLKLLASIGALFAVSSLLPGVHVNNWVTAGIAVLILGGVNAIVKPVLMLLTLPLNFMTLGLFTFVLNAILFGLGAWLVPGFEVNGFFYALIGSVMYGFLASVANTLLHWLVGATKSPVKYG